MKTVNKTFFLIDHRIERADCLAGNGRDKD